MLDGPRASRRAQRGYPLCPIERARPGTDVEFQRLGRQLRDQPRDVRVEHRASSSIRRPAGSVVRAKSVEFGACTFVGGQADRRQQRAE